MAVSPRRSARAWCWPHCRRRTTTMSFALAASRCRTRSPGCRGMETHLQRPAWRRRRLGHPGHRRHRQRLRPRPARRCPARGWRPSGRAARVAPRPSPRSTAAPAAGRTASYEALVADPDVDVVYIATPHALHLDNARLAFEAGKHVLCEKPLTLNAAEAEEMVRLAGEHDRFLMEAMWMACHPVIRAVRDGLAPAGSARRGTCTPSIGFVVEPAADRPAARPGARRRRPARHGRLPADLRRPDARPGRASCAATADLDRPRHRPRRRHRRPVPRRRGRRADGDDDVVLRGTATIATDTGPGRPRSGFFNHPSRRLDARTTASRSEIDGVEPLLGNGLATRRPRCSAACAAGLRESPLVPHEQTLPDPAPDGRPAAPGRPRLPGRGLTAATRTCSSSVRR